MFAGAVCVYVGYGNAGWSLDGIGVLVADAVCVLVGMAEINSLLVVVGASRSAFAGEHPTIAIGIIAAIIKSLFMVSIFNLPG